MQQLHFYKYAANGNNFVIIDEIEQILLTEPQKAELAKMICNPATGIGCDTLIFIQRYHRDHLPGIKIVGEQPPDYIMRIFEQNGFESDCCGNGLVCLGHHLATNYAITHSTIATEVPSGQATLRAVKQIGNGFQICMGAATLPKPRLIDLDNIAHRIINGTIYALNGIATIDLSYFTYTGTPHVVIFVTEQTPELSRLFDPEAQRQQELMERIGQQFNQLTDTFPLGTNVNFAKVIDEKRIAYRCYERGVYHETYACGTGATAVATVAQALGYCSKDRVSILPWYARRNPFYQQAEIIIEQRQKCYLLKSQAHCLAQGQFYPMVTLKTETDEVTAGALAKLTD